MVEVDRGNFTTQRLNIDDYFCFQNGRIVKRLDPKAPKIFDYLIDAPPDTASLDIARGDFHTKLILQTSLPYDKSAGVAEIGKPGHQIPVDWSDTKKYGNKYPLTGAAVNLNHYIYWDKVAKKIVVPTSPQLLRNVSHSVACWDINIKDAGPNKLGTVVLTAIVLQPDETLTEKTISLTGVVGWEGSATNGKIVAGSKKPLWANGVRFEIWKNGKGHPSITALNAADQPIAYLALNKLVVNDGGELILKQNYTETPSYFETYVDNVGLSVPGASIVPVIDAAKAGQWNKFKFTLAKCLNTHTALCFSAGGALIGGVAGFIIGDITGVAAGILVEGFVKECIQSAEWRNKISPITFKRVKDDIILNFIGGRVAGELFGMASSVIKPILGWIKKVLTPLLSEVISDTLERIINGLVTPLVAV
ncbi:hypothetical protein ABW19_dt0203213 [Dactylella cylindrospora]|nr:hypothetical protein ABW19_dt0203213 [Dactylella cylindrospora]